MEFAFLNDILIIFALATAILLISHRLGMPSIIGFLLTGIAAGPNGLGLIHAEREVVAFAEIGIVLLLFTIGLEFSFKSIRRIGRPVFLGGPLQVIFTFLVGFGVSLVYGLPAGQSTLIGFLLALSSTAIVLKLLQERAELDSPHGRNTFGILIFQDMAIIPMMLLVPALAGSADGSGAALLTIAKAAAILPAVFVVAKWVVPNLLYQVARTRDRELFVLSVVFIGLAIAWSATSLGVSAALGAFLAGLIIAESEYSHQALGNILPFRDLFTSFFFISIGMLLDTELLLSQPLLIVLAAGGVLVLKSITAGGATLLLGFPIRTAVFVALALGQVGEFSFILAKSGLEHGLLSSDAYQFFLAISVLTMAATPVLIGLAPRAAHAISRLPIPQRFELGGSSAEDEKKTALKDHLVIIGFGFNGRNLAHAAGILSLTR